MVIKSADDRSSDVAELNRLRQEPNLTPTQRKRIQDELANLEKGAWGELRAAYFLNFHFSDSKNNLVLHDLRLELSDGRTAQIDHLIINRMMYFYILESKNWNQLTVAKDGTCSIWRGRVVGVESPLEQAKRHAKVFAAVLLERPEIKMLIPRNEIVAKVLVAPGCNLRAPHHQGLYVKADHFHEAWNREFNDVTIIKAAVGLSRWSSLETLSKVGETIASLHRPKHIDWRAKFDLPSPNMTTEVTTHPVVSSIEGLAAYVPRWGDDWFVLKAEPTDATKKLIKAAGYRAKQENGEWVWRLKP